MKKVLYTLLVLMLAMVASDALAQKTVTYTFKGRAKGYILPPKPLDLVPSGDIPAGVRVSNFYITQDSEGNNVDNPYEGGQERIEDVEMDGFAGSALLTEYVIEPQTTAHVLFDGFRYEIVGVKWNRCSEIAVLTSKGNTWVESWNNVTVGHFSFDTTGEEGYSTGGELFYHTRNFLNETTNGDPTYPFTGIRSLNIDCTSRLPQHGIAVKNFKIEYYEPVITITGNESVLATVDQTNTIGATITAHPGAFVNSEIKYKSEDENIAKVTGTGTSATVRGIANGNTTIIAYIEYGGTMITQAKYKVRVGEEPEWAWSRGESVFSEWHQGTNGVPFNRNNQDYVYYDGTNTRLHIESSDDRRFEDNFETSKNNYTGLVSSIIDQCNVSSGNTSVDFRSGVQKIYYKHKVPEYTSVKVTHDLQVHLINSNSDNTSPMGAELVYLGQTQNSDPDIWGPNSTIRFNTGDNSTKYNNNTNYKTTVIRHNDGNGGASSSSAIENDYPFSFDNSKIDDKTWFKENLAGTAYYRRNSSNTGVSGYRTHISNAITQTDHKATYTYYAYIKYDGNEGGGSVTNGSGSKPLMPTGAHNVTDPSDGAQTISFAAKVNLKVIPDNDILSAETSLREGTKLQENSFTKTNAGGNECKFLGWAVSQANADAMIVDYKDQQEFNPYDEEGECGKGPRTLYAVWQDPDATYPDDVDPDDDDILVYAVMGNGGTIDSKDRLEATFKKGQTAPTNITAAIRDGWTFEGYYDSGATTDGEVQLYDAYGNITAAAYNSDYISTTGKWAANSDVILYAHWTRVAAAVTHTITFNANGGNITAPTTRVLTVGESDNNNVSGLKPVGADTNSDDIPDYKFVGWFTQPSGGMMAYNANGESVELESITKDPSTGTTYNYRAVNPLFFGTDLQYKGESPFGTPTVNSSYTLYAQWMPVATKIAFHEGTTSENSAAYKSGSDPIITAPASEPGKMYNPGYAETEYGEVILTRALKDGKWNTICFPCFISKEQTKELFSKVKQYNALEYSAPNATMKFKDSNAIVPGVPYFVQLVGDEDEDGQPDYPKLESQSSTGAWIEIGTGNMKTIHVKNSDVIKNPTSLTYSDNGCTVSMEGKFNTQLHIGDGDDDLTYYYLQNDSFYESGGTFDVDGDGIENEVVWGNNKGFRCYFTQPKPAPVMAMNLHLDLEGYDGWSGDDGIEDVWISYEEEHHSNGIYDLQGRRLSSRPAMGVYIMNGKKFIVK